jgi:lipopolysaccharide biosynthesis glycosyltransferase
MKRLKIFNDEEKFKRQSIYYFVIKNNLFKVFLLFFIIINILSLIFIIENKSYINVAYAFDKNYHYITHISMKSIMISQNKGTYIIFHILVSNISIFQKNIIDRINIEHKNCKIKYYQMRNKFKNFKISNSIWSTANFYRIILPELLPKEKKLLFLDTDTLIYKDLTELYNYNIKGKYFVGMLEPKSKRFFNKFNTNFDNFINTGAMLFNLEELRKGKISEKIQKFLMKHFKELRSPVNEAVNYITFSKNGYFTPKFVVTSFCNKYEVLSYCKHLKIKINCNQVLKAYKNPYIYHFIGHKKPWKKITNYKEYACFDPIIRFYEMARKTHYYYDILKFFKVKSK